MKYLLAPTFAVVFSTVGTAYGCYAVGMPVHDIKLATLLAGTVSSFAAYGAVLLASARRTIPAQAGTAQRR